jgi:hypothetical protein
MPRKFTFTTQVYDKKTDFPQTGDVDVIYIDASKNIAYRYDDSYYTISSAEVDIWGAMGSLSKGGGGGGGASWGSISGTLSSQTDLQTALNAKQNTLVSGTNIKTINSTSVLGSGNIAVQAPLTLTTTGTSGAATLSGATLNIPQYSGGGGIHSLLEPSTGFVVSGQLTAAGLGSASMTANRMLLNPFIPAKTFTSSNLFIRVQGAIASSFAKILIYSDLNGRPNTLLFESANLDCSTTGNKIATTSFTFSAGTTYWLAYWGNSTQQVFTIAAANMITIRSQGSTPSPSNVVLTLITYGSAPNPLTGFTESLNNMPFIGITQP